MSSPDRPHGHPHDHPHPHDHDHPHPHAHPHQQAWEPADPTGLTSTLWVDASAGVAGDMLLGALLDAGATLAVVQQAVDAVLPGAIRLEPTTVTRNHLRATKVTVHTLEADSPHRGWSTIRGMLAEAELDPVVRERATAVFARIAVAEARAHGVDPEEIHFHEVGALDSIADVVGCCAALTDLGVQEVLAGPIAVGSGRVRAVHGVMPVPVPAVSELSRGWEVEAGGEGHRLGELATPTGVALVTTLAERCSPLPPMRLSTVGVGAGTRERADRANVVRVLLGERTGRDPSLRPAVQLEATVDDLDPRIWPEVIAAVMTAGAWDVWLSPTLGKKGRPGHVVHALTGPAEAAAVRGALLTHTTTIGVRQSDLLREALPREFVDIELDGAVIPVKVSSRAGTVLAVTPEFDVVAELARRTGRPVREVLAAAQVAAAAAGLVVGASRPARG